MQEGPWIPYLKNIVHNNNNISSRILHGKPILSYIANDCFCEIATDKREFIDERLNELKDLSDAKIKTRVYLTAPMKYILRQENTGRTMIKVPVLYNNLTVEELDKTNT